jgi:Na+-transporting methylmalonyl-CoA/oxaloacetate decarboxylase gamma subunit
MEENMNTQDVLYALEIMGKGMLSIFIVILILTFIVMLLGKFAGKKKKSDTAEE